MQTKSNQGVPTTPITTGILNDYVERIATHNKEILEISERIKSKMNTITPFFPPSNNDVAQYRRSTKQSHHGLNKSSTSCSRTTTSYSIFSITCRG
jgi:hypothetical protein